MSDRIKYRAFTASYEGIVDELITPAVVLPAPVLNESSNTTPIEVTAVWDTGATGSCITPQLKERLGLQLYDTENPTPLAGIGGEVNAPTAFINIRLLSNAEIEECPVSVADFPGDEDLLIGMDIIGKGDFVVCNANGKTSFSFAVPSFPDRIDLIGKAEIANRTGC